MGVDPRLSPLGNFGGPTPTHVPLIGSPLFNSGDSTVDLAEFDQRGENFPRVLLGQVDIGAVELSGISTQLPATGLVVSSTVDLIDNDHSFGNLSLREAILIANANPGMQTIEFAFPSGGPQTIQLVSSLPTITESVNIVGPGSSLLSIDAGNGVDGVANTADGFRVLKVASDLPGELQEVEISGLTITGGDIALTGDQPITFAPVEGGGILNEEALTLLDVNVSGNAALSIGGGIANLFGDVVLQDSTIANNFAFDGGGIGNGAFSNAENAGTVQVTDSVIEGNAATGHGGGGGGIVNRGMLSIVRSDVRNNQAEGFGGGLLNRSQGRVTIDQSTFSDNTTDHQGGGIVNDGQLFVSNSTLHNNVSLLGDGGGLTNSDGLVRFVNSTISSNSAAGTGGGINNDGTSLLFVLNSTLTLNSAGLGGGGVSIEDPERNFFLGTIVADNVSGSVPSDIAGSINGSFNLIGDVASAGGFVNGVGSNLVGLDPRLAPLAFNGGPTQTHALLEDSPAIAAGRPSNVFFLGIPFVDQTPIYDQRGEGFARVVVNSPIGSLSSGSIDIGAFEFGNPLPPSVVTVVRDGRLTGQVSELARPDLLQLVEFQFSEDVIVSASDLSLVNQLDMSTEADLSGAIFNYDSSTFTATWDLTSLASPVDSGFYSVKLSDTVLSASTNLGLNQPVDEQIHVALPGDANLDGRVDVLGDAFPLVGGLGTTSGATWAQGDFTGDGKVDVLGDAFVLVGNLGRDVRPTFVSSFAASTPFNLTATQDVLNFSPNESFRQVSTLEIYSSTPHSQSGQQFTEDITSTARKHKRSSLVLSGTQKLRDDVFGNDFLI